ncbi:ImuA family protein [Mucilaginibacter glaciei]|uniref:Error-prone repair protein ImuA n=1 Tax=Mucilaginibacter glaciei TaxID=2772109 RepID=A0A926NN44_9SPHI|nr:Error-prone repair protein ImuA [Mucilaginibacter glaciei]MBD1391937.1 Error-prone repair protein ImuA [Mucilaginibacter glaciei]
MENRQQVIGKLRQDLLHWEGYKPPVSGRYEQLGLGALEHVFPNGVFPKNCIHELVCASIEQAAASGGFVSAVLSLLIQTGGVCVWIGRARRLYAPALAAFGVAPHQVIFITLHKDKDALWVMEEALKCTGLTAVVCELREMDFKQSRRFQLAVESSRVTGFVLRNATDKLSSTACAARWQIKSLPSTELDGLPGLGFLRWQVDLLKVRNGHTGSWQLEWQDGCFVPVKELIINEERQVG